MPSVRLSNKQRTDTMDLNELNLALVSRVRNRLGFARTARVSVPFLGYELCPINFDEHEVSDAEAASVLGAFLALSNTDRLQMSAHVFAHYSASMRAMADEYDDEWDMLGGKRPAQSAEDVWRLVTGSDLMVRKENGVLYVLVVSDCEWELDHGFCIILRHGTELVKVDDLNCESLEVEHPGWSGDLAAPDGFIPPGTFS